MERPFSIKALILMGGRGARFNSPLPKQFHLLGEKKIYLQTLDIFVGSALFHEIILVCAQERIEEVESDVQAYTNVRVVAGGATRQDSSYLGLSACGDDTDYVVIHDAVRPFVSRAILQRNVDACKRHDAIDTCIPSADTLIKTHDGQTIDAIPLRREFMRGQTPQTFSYKLILEAHAHAKKSGMSTTDDCALVVAMGRRVEIVAGEEENMKITTDFDFTLAQHLFEKRAQEVVR